MGAELGNQFKYRVGVYQDAIPISQRDELEPILQNGVTAGIGYTKASVRLNIGLDYNWWVVADIINLTQYDVEYSRVKVSSNIIVTF